MRGDQQQEKLFPFSAILVKDPRACNAAFPGSCADKIGLMKLFHLEVLPGIAVMLTSEMDKVFWLKLLYIDRKLKYLFYS